MSRGDISERALGLMHCWALDRPTKYRAHEDWMRDGVTVVNEIIRLVSAQARHEAVDEFAEKAITFLHTDCFMEWDPDNVVRQAREMWLEEQESSDE